MSKSVAETALREPTLRVSIIIPAHNSACFVTQAVDSALAQTQACCEVIVVDDGSIDDTANLLAAYQSKVRYLHQDNTGPSSARNRGLAAAQGEFVVFLDSDDVLLPTKVADQLACFAADPDLDLVHSGWQLLDQSGSPGKTIEPWLAAPRPGAPGLDLESLLRCHAFCLPAVMFRREVLEAAGGFDAQLRQAEDVDLMLRVMLGGCRSSWLKKTTVMYRQHPGNLTRQTRQRVESVNRVFATFFSRPDLPPGIAAIEKQIVYHVLMWGAWQLYRAGDTGEIPRYLQQTCAFLAGSKSQILHAWLEQILQLGREEGRGDEMQALGEFLPWCRAAFAPESSLQPGAGDG